MGTLVSFLIQTYFNTNSNRRPTFIVIKFPDLKKRKYLSIFFIIFWNLSFYSVEIENVQIKRFLATFPIIAAWNQENRLMAKWPVYPTNNALGFKYLLIYKLWKTVLSIEYKWYFSLSVIFPQCKISKVMFTVWQ